MTSVRPLRASACQSGSAPSFVCPVTKMTPRAASRCVTGMPEASPAVMPGITSASMPAARSASSSSPPRPNTKGSPPLSRTTLLPCCAYCTISRSMNSCGVLLQPPRLPTSMTFASERACARQPRLTRSSINTISASRSVRAAFNVISSGSPGPAPISQTLPLFIAPLSVKGRRRHHHQRTVGPTPSCTEPREQQQEEPEAESEGHALPEEHGVALDERRRAQQRCVGVPQVVDELRKRLVALERIRMHRLPQSRVDPCRNVTEAGVFQLALRRARTHPGGLGAVGKPAAQHLVG